MTNDALDRFVDDYFERLLAWVEHIERDDATDASLVHKDLLSHLQQWREKHQGDQRWKPAVYALAALSDELMLETPWPGRTWWNDHVFEVHLFGTRRCSDQFFVLARKAARDPSSGVLRVFHDCVLLGFRGIYAITELGESVTRELGIPPTLDMWLMQTQQRLGEDPRSEHAEPFHRQLVGAAPQSSRHKIVWWSVAAGTMLVANIAAFSLLLHT
tara:strand:+ start:20105 stop:20749 length:645 start_codon:yes stop_codon:yes gene_type:complete